MVSYKPETDREQLPGAWKHFWNSRHRERISPSFFSYRNPQIPFNSLVPFHRLLGGGEGQRGSQISVFFLEGASVALMCMGWGVLLSPFPFPNHIPSVEDGGGREGGGGVGLHICRSLKSVCRLEEGRGGRFGGGNKGDHKDRRDKEGGVENEGAREVGKGQ